MRYSDEQLSELRKRVSASIGEKRFRHTLGVERAAALLAKKILPHKESELRAAALLHDITKELSTKEQMDIIVSLADGISQSDLMTPAIYHSITAPYIIKRDFSEFCTDEICRAVRNHTVGSPNMSLFDEIIFVSDYVEEGRTYPACIEVRERLFLRLSRCRDEAECAEVLHDATIESLDNTIVSLVKRGGFLHETTVMTRNAFLGRKPMPLN